MNQKLRQLLEKNKHFCSIIDYVSKTGFVDVSIDSMERYSNSDTPEAPNPDGTFDHEGTDAVDINGYYYMYPLSNLDDLMSVCRCAWDWLSFSLRHKSWYYFKEAHPFKKKWEQWLFVVDSFKCARHEVAEAHELAKLYLSHGNYKAYHKFTADLTPTITDAEVNTHLLKTGHFMVTPGFYVSESDPTCMLFNQKYFPFDLKDGWSHMYVLGLLMRYFASAGIHVSIREGKRIAYSQRNLSIKRFNMRKGKEHVNLKD